MRSILPSYLFVAINTKLNLSTIVQRKKSVGGEKSMFAGLKNLFPEVF
jgi:hypothetical protein